MNPTFQETVNDICKKDPRYQPEAYSFLLEALDATVKKIRKEDPEHGRHVSGKELLAGIRDHALAEFGPLTFTVFAEWGIHATSDFGELVFHLVEAGRLGKTESDSREDFQDFFPFKEVFLDPFEPQRKTPLRKGKKTRKD